VVAGAPYTLRIIAANDAGVWNTDGASLGFTIPKEPVRHRVDGIETVNVLRGGEGAMNVEDTVAAIPRSSRYLRTIGRRQ